MRKERRAKEGGQHGEGVELKQKTGQELTPLNKKDKQIKEKKTSTKKEVADEALEMKINWEESLSNEDGKMIIM